MKRLLVLLPLLWLSNTLAESGDRGGNGGDPLAADFVARGHFLVSSLKTGADRALLTAAQTAEVERAVRLVRIEFVDKPLSAGLCSVEADPAASGRKLIRVYRRDWEESVRLNVDLLQPVFKAYLKAAGVADPQDELADGLKVTERDFQNRVRVNPDCPAGTFERIRIVLNIALDFPGLRSPAYINGVDFDPGDRTNHRIFDSQRLCTTKYHRFEIRIGSFTEVLDLFGGQRVQVSVPGQGTRQ